MKFVVFPRRDKLGRPRWYWHAVGVNGEVISQSEGYSRRVDARSAVERIQTEALLAEVEVREA